MSAAADDATNEHAPPSSAEEAAALLGAAISLDAPPSTASSPPPPDHANPPRGMHSIFTVQSPLPNQALFVRLCNLRAWLRWHADALDDASDFDGDEGLPNHRLGISFPTRKATKEPFNAARSILAVLMKLLEASSIIATGGEIGSNIQDDAASKVVKSLTSPIQPKQRKGLHGSQAGKNARQHKPLPPLLSTPIRNMWVECISLCLALGCSLPGNLRIDVTAFLGKMMEICNWNPRSKMASGGVRLATLEVLGRVCRANADLAKRSSTCALEVLQCCHRGLLSGGAGEPGHRAACVRTACGVLEACRSAARGTAAMVNGGGPVPESFSMPGALDERVATEALKFARRAASDKYPEVRMGAAVFVGLAAPMLVRNVRDPPGGGHQGKDSHSLSPLSWLEDATQISMHNVDDESAGVATAWASALARCLCASAEHGRRVQDAKSEDQASKRSADVDDEAAPAASDNNLDLAAKLKAFSSDLRRSAVATAACASVPATVAYLVSQFVKCGGETSSKGCGGSYSIGGRASRIGYADALAEFMRLQAAKGDYALVGALGPVLEMVGARFDKQIRKKEGASMNEMDFYAPASPRSPHDKKPQTTSMFMARNTKAKSTADSNVGRLLASRVIRKGISENLSEQSQLKVLRELILACRSSVSPASADGGSGSVTADHSENEQKLNRHQLQVILIEISHIIVALGEAAASSLEDLMSVLLDCLSHIDHGVRHEAAAVYASIAQAFPSEGRVFVILSLGSFGANLDAIQTLSTRVASSPFPSQKNRFRRNNDKSEGNTPGEELLKHQATLHGQSLAVSMLMHEFPHIFGGVATAIVSKVFDVIDKLLQCQFNDSFVKSNPSAACTCIRAGYCMLSGALTMGIQAIVPDHVTTVFRFWQQSSMNILPGRSRFSASHDLLWLETMLISIVSFLKFSPALLLAVPDALTRLTALLEKVFPLISSGGRFEREANDPVGAARLASARSSVLEAYSWLPPGSFPLSADRVFSFAAHLIQDLSSNDILCSVLEGLVSREDKLIDAHSIGRAVSAGEVGGSVTLDNNILIRSSDVVHHNEREAILHLLAWRKSLALEMSKQDDILSLYLREGDEKAPTPLHEVGTWRSPLDPTGASKVRLLDSSIHAFAATFGLQDGHTQHDALKMLENLYVFQQTEKANRFHVGSSLIAESQGKVKPLEEDVMASNVVATVLACLQSLPLHESTYDTLIDRGPPWMERATSLLLRLLPSPSGIIRRGAAEGLSLLATLGASEDAHTLLSTILHSLDEVMKGSATTTNPKTHQETVSFAKAGALLTLACVQRAAKRMKKNEEERAIARSVSRDDPRNPENDDKTPVMIMITRVMPSLATHKHDTESLLARTYALHSFGVLISNSISTDSVLTTEQLQIIWKAVESVESSFLGAWSAVDAKGREREKFASEPAFLSVLLRLMTTLVPWLKELKSLDRFFAGRFAAYASTILEFSHNHPVVLFEGSVFFERLSVHRYLLEPNSCMIVTTENLPVIALPFLMKMLRPPYPNILAESEDDFSSCEGPNDSQRAAILCMKSLCASSLVTDGTFTIENGKAIFSFLHDRCGRRRFQHFSDHRSLALSRAAFTIFEDDQMVETEAISLIQDILNAQVAWKEENEKSIIILQWLLFSRCLASGDGGRRGDVNHDMTDISGIIESAKSTAQLSASQTLRYSNPPRWQIKCVSANVAAVAMMMLVSIDKETGGSGSLFNLQSAQSMCRDMLKNAPEGNGTHSTQSKPILHLEELVKTACGTSTATSNHSELPSVQISGLRLLVSLFHAFSSQVDVTSGEGESVLEQYLSQILSSVKHALNSESSLNDSVPGTAFHSLFSSGCDALSVMLSKGLISDPAVMRRILQPVLISAEDTPFVTYPAEDGNDKSSLLMSSACNVTDDSRSFPLFRLSKLCFLSKASMMIALGDISTEQSAIATVTSEIEKGEIGRAVHCAAVAMDGFLLQNAQRSKSRRVRSGLTYKNLHDVDESVIESLIKNWPTMGAFSVTSIIKAMKAADKASDEFGSLRQWLSKLIPVMISGLRSSLSDLPQYGREPPLEQSSASETATMCVHAVRQFVRDNEYIGQGLCSNELGDIANLVFKSVIVRVLESEVDECDNQKFQRLLRQCMGLIQDLCEHYLDTGVDVSMLTQVVVSPLASLQDKDGRVGKQASQSLIIASFIRSSQLLLRNYPEEGRAEFEKALVQLVLTLVKESSDKNCEIQAACLALLKDCCEMTMMTEKEWGQIAKYSATGELWEAWAIICAALPPGQGIRCSIGAIKTSLGDLKSGPRHTAALVTLRAALHAASVEDPPLLSFVLQSVGFEILQLLRAHSVRILAGVGFDENRVTVCADSVKINLMAFQYLNSVSKEESKFITFVVAIFEILAESIKFNGLPNHPSGNTGADETIGRMGAQFFVHVARTTPMLFKTTMSAISLESRTVMEAAVRADMSGYAAPKRETKKKISLKGFVKK